MQPAESRTQGSPRGKAASADRCPICSGTGFRILEDTERGRSYAEPCTCRRERRAQELLRAARVPRRYATCDFGSFYTGPEFDPSLERGLRKTREFVSGYTARKVGGETEFGLLFLGPPGAGKTHLAVAALQSLILEHGVTGLFADFREMIKAIQSSYDAVSQTSEMQILQPLLHAEVLLLDDLGVCRMTEWVRDMVGHIVSTRYNERRVTLITTNLEDETSPKARGRVADRESHREGRLARRIAGRPSLADRIGPEVRSRLHEMCEIVQLQDEDYRLRVGRHRGRA